MQDEATVTAAEIARMAGVGRAAVSNWRRRHDDFPEPVGGTATSPAFSLVAVEGWLRDQNKLGELPAEERAWRSLRGVADDLQLPMTLASLGAFLAYLDRDEQGWRRLARKPDPELVRELSVKLREREAELPAGSDPRDDAVGKYPPLFRAAADLAGEGGPGNAYELLVGRFLETHYRRVIATPKPLARLMADLATLEPATVLDPACGTGTLLREMAGRVTADGRLFGQEIDESLTRVAVSRLLLAGARADIRAGDSLLADDPSRPPVDLVLCNPPFNERNWGHEQLTTDRRWEYGLPPKMESELAWVQHAIAHLRPGGQAILLMPPGAAFRRTGRRIRAELLRRGALRAVIGLPPGIAAHTGMALHLWLLSRPEGAQRTPESLFVAEMTAERSNQDELVRSWKRFAAGTEANTREPDGSRAVPIVELLDDEVDLTPGRRLSPAGGRAAERFRQVRARVEELAGALGGLAPDADTETEPQSRPLISIAELVRIKALSIVQSLGGPGENPRDGDVIVTVHQQRVTARVEDGNGERPPASAQLLRPDPEAIDPWFLAGFLRGSVHQSPRATTSNLTRTDLRRLRVPRLGLGEQRRYGELFRTVERFSVALRETATAGTDLVEALTEGLSDGSLTPMTHSGQGRP